MKNYFDEVQGHMLGFLKFDVNKVPETMLEKLNGFATDFDARTYFISEGGLGKTFTQECYSQGYHDGMDPDGVFYVDVSEALYHVNFNRLSGEVDVYVRPSEASTYSNAALARSYVHQENAQRLFDAARKLNNGVKRVSLSLITGRDEDNQFIIDSTASYDVTAEMA